MIGAFPDGRTALVASGTQLVRQSLDGEERVVLMDNPRGHVALSPDGRGLAFVEPARPDGKAALYAAELSNGPPARDSWRLLAEDRNVLASPAWSPDGTILYYLSQRDGFKCAWAQRVTPDLRPAGAPIASLHVHTDLPPMEFSMGPRLAATKGRLFLLITSVAGDIWSVKLQP